VTGVSYIGKVSLQANKLDSYTELLPEATRFAVLANPNNPLVNNSIVYGFARSGFHQLGDTSKSYPQAA